MSLILGMDIWAFTAWIGTILAAILCMLYGIYTKYIEKIRKNKENKTSRKEAK